jgi:hypothetical protein
MAALERASNRRQLDTLFRVHRSPDALPPTYITSSHASRALCSGAGRQAWPGSFCHGCYVRRKKKQSKQSRSTFWRRILGFIRSIQGGLCWPKFSYPGFVDGRRGARYYVLLLAWSPSSPSRRPSSHTLTAWQPWRVHGQRCYLITRAFWRRSTCERAPVRSTTSIYLVDLMQDRHQGRGS